MNDHEAQRIAAAMHEMRPDWPASSLLTLIRRNMIDKPRRDVAVALAWVACESGTATPARVLESGPWWKAVAIEGGARSDPYDIGTACGICEKTEDRCRANPYGEHEFVPKVEVIRQRTTRELGSDHQQAARQAARAELRGRNETPEGEMA